MERERLDKLNIRVLILLLFFTTVFLAGCGFILANMFFDSLEPSMGVATWSVIGLTLTILTLVFWYFKTKKFFPLKVRRRRIVLYSLLVFLPAYLLFGSFIFSRSDVVFGSIVMIVFLVFFIRQNKLKGYSTRMLMLLSLGVGIILIHMTTIFLYKYLTSEDGWGVIEFLNAFFGFFPILVIKVPPLIFSLVGFSTIISFVPINDSTQNEVLDS